MIRKSAFWWLRLLLLPLMAAVTIRITKGQPSWLAGGIQGVVGAVFGGMAWKAVNQLKGDSEESPTDVLRWTLNVILGRIVQVTIQGERARRPPRLSTAAKVSMVLVPKAKRGPLTSDLLADRKDHVRFPSINELHATVVIGLQSRYAQLLNRLGIPGAGHWWINAGDRNLAIRVPLAALLTANGHGLIELVWEHGGRFGVLPGTIWVLRILRGELLAARAHEADTGRPNKL